MHASMSIPYIQRVAWVPVLICLATGRLLGDENRIVGDPAGRILAAGDQRVMLLSPTGGILWEYPTKLTHDIWMLPSGNVLFADGETVTEVTPEKKVIFQYRPAQQKGGGAYACQPLPDGKTLVGENSTGRVLEVGADGRIAFSLQTSPFKFGDHQNLRMARKLPNGHYLVCHSGARLVKEYDVSGKATWEVKVKGPLAFAAIRTPEGTTLVSSLDEVTEFDSSGGIVWECAVQDLSGAAVRNVTGIHRLSNGNLVAGCYRAYRDGRGCGLLEFSREKKVIWHYTDPTADNTMMAVQMLTWAGTPLPGPCLR